MAVKSEAQVLTLLQEIANGIAEFHVFAATYVTARDAITAAISAADDQPEDADQLAAIRAVTDAMESVETAWRALARTLHATLGRLGGSTNLADEYLNIEAFRAYCVTNSKSVLSAGHTRGSVSAGGSNVGNGQCVIHRSNRANAVMDITHGQAVILRCTQSQFSGAQEGQELFTVIGAAKAGLAWQNGGTAQRSDWREHPHGKGTADWPANIIRVSDGSTIRAVDASVDGVVVNGQFAGEVGSTGAGAETIPSWETVSGGTNLDIDDTAASNNQFDQKLEFSGDFLIKQAIAGRIKAGVPYLLTFNCRVAAAITDGDIIVRVKDDSTTHIEIEVDSTALTNDTWSNRTAQVLVLPKNLGENLRVEVEVEDYAGSGSGFVENVVLAEMVMFDEGSFLGIVGGPIRFRDDDLFTYTDAFGTGGEIQRLIFNRAFGTYARHADPAVGLGDKA